MAAAARPGPSEARVPCPLCGGLVHPIAGKCKHCKADLTSYHAARPAASQPLPSLHAAVHSVSDHSANGHAYAPPGVASPAAAPVGPVSAMVAAAREAAQPVQPVLPPRPAHAYPAQPRASSWRSWPIVVIVVAVLAILAAVVLMVLPEFRSSQADGRRTLPPPPAPERMQTEPELNQPAVRPQPAPPARPAPAVPQPDPPRRPSAAAGDTDDTDDGSDAVVPDGHDPSGANPAPSSAITEAILVHVCQKLQQCGIRDLSTKRTCDAVADAHAVPPINCGAAIRCVARIDSLTCDTPSGLRAQLDELFHRGPDCASIRC